MGVSSTGDLFFSVFAGARGYNKGNDCVLVIELGAKNDN